MTIRRRIVLATRIFTPEPAAASFRLQALADALAAQGHEVTVLTTTPPRGAVERRPGAAAPVRERPGTRPAHDHPPTRPVRVRRWPVLRDAQGYVRGYLQYLSFDLPLALRLLLTRADVVVAEPPPTTGAVVRAVAALKRVPYVYYAADVWSDAAAATGAPKVVVRALRTFERWVLRGAAAVVTVSAEAGARLAALAGVTPHVSPFGVDTSTFAPDGSRHEPGGYFLYAGSASEWHGADIFVRALPLVLRQHPASRLVFIGRSIEEEKLRRLAAELAPGAVEFHPTVGPSELAPWQRGAVAALASLVPGVGYDFAYPTKILPALASGTPVIYAGPGPAAHDIQQGALGRAVPYEVEAVAEAMIDAQDNGVDHGERRRLAEWVRTHRSLRATGETAATVVLAAVRRR